MKWKEQKNHNPLAKQGKNYTSMRLSLLQYTDMEIPSTMQSQKSPECCQFALKWQDNYLFPLCALDVSIFYAIINYLALAM